MGMCMAKMVALFLPVNRNTYIMGGRKLLFKKEKNSERKHARLVCRPKGRPPKRGSKTYQEYKEKVAIYSKPRP